MTIKLYVEVNGEYIPLGTFKSVDAALEYFHAVRHNYRQTDGSIGKPIWVDTKKRRNNHGK